MRLICQVTDCVPDVDSEVRSLQIYENSYTKLIDQNL